MSNPNWKIIETELPGVCVVSGPVYRDERGWFQELWNPCRYTGEALERESFVQDNLSVSRPGVIRGLHYQHPQGQGKLIGVLTGSIFDVAVDIRVGSPTFGKWVGVELVAGEGRQMFIPPGFAHGFAVRSAELATILYKCTNAYDPRCEGAIRWDDPELGIPWKIDDPVLSEKDGKAATLRAIPAGRLPQYS